MSDTAGHVLITSAGRRVQLVRFFQRALKDQSLSGRVLVGEANPVWSAAAHIADAAIRMPRVTDEGYDRFLLDLVEREGVRLIVPTIDTELLRLSKLRGALLELQCNVSVSDVELIEICRDKRRSDIWFREMGFSTPEIFDRDRLRFPCFVKPYDGSLSQGAKALLSPDMLSPGLLSDEKLLFMELLSPAQYDEFTIDAYYSRLGELKCLVPRKRVEVRGGEISKGTALKGATYDYLHDRLCSVRGARGCLTFQFFASRTEARWVAIELNPRFGGGYPLSYAAGANYPEWLIQEYFLGKEIPEFDEWKDRTAMARYDAEVIFTLPDAE
jgi:carbamoyl-phosphate synthase large subunit